MLTTKNINKYDCFLFIFHDQALIPFKYISKFYNLEKVDKFEILNISL